jgi:hypothetical protein
VLLPDGEGSGLTRSQRCYGEMQLRYAAAPCSLNGLAVREENRECVDVSTITDLPECRVAIRWRLDTMSVGIGLGRRLLVLLFGLVLCSDNLLNGAYYILKANRITGIDSFVDP